MDLFVALACAVSSVSGCWLVFARLTDGVGWFGFGVVAYLVFLGLFFVATNEREGRLVAVDRTVQIAVSTGALVVLLPLIWVVVYIAVKGAPGLTPGFFVHDQRGISPLEPATSGGGLHAIVGTVEEVGLAVTFALPLGALAALFLNESRSRWRRPVRIFVDAMSGLPSIIAGLFIYAVFILPFGKDTSVLDFNGLMAALALSLDMLPTVCRTIEVVLRLLPDGLREASMALGASRARTVWSVLLPTARSGITTAVVLAIARAVGETAPLLFTAFGNTLLNTDPLKGTQESLPLFIYRYIRQPSRTSIERGYTGALVLMLLVLALFVLSRLAGRDRSRQRRRRGFLTEGSVRPSSRSPDDRNHRARPHRTKSGRPPRRGTASGRGDVGGT
jgi:phosphate transport system permease protein